MTAEPLDPEREQASSSKCEDRGLTHQWMSCIWVQTCMDGGCPAIRLDGLAQLLVEAERRGKEVGWDEGLSAGCDRWADARVFGDPPVNPYRSPQPEPDGGTQ